ncbi:hypothetical protein BGZ82_004693 [Podila clonocystis]|nr:hypothetical protein BGZ82_004693 [Podila clonocystis]
MAAAFKGRESLTQSETARLSTFLSECLLVGTLKGFYYFEVYLRGREELLLQVYNDIKPPSNGIGNNTQPNSITLAKSRPTNILSTRTLRSLKSSSSKKAPPPLSPIDTELEKDESRATFLIAGYPRYKCPYVWLRSNHKRLIQNNNDQKVEANDPLKLSTISSWRTDDVRLWDIMAEIITLTLSPSPVNPFRINHVYFDTLPLEECVIATGAMMDFLQRVYMKDTPYTESVYSDIKQLQKLHFILYDELHSFLTERSSDKGNASHQAHHTSHHLHNMSSSTSKRPSDQELTQTYNTMKSELSSLAQKIGELETEADEHSLVVDTIAPLDGDRKCFRLVGGVLVERTVKEVLPALKTNQEGIRTVTTQLVQTYKKKEDEFMAFQKKYNIQVKQ